MNKVQAFLALTCMLGFLPGLLAQSMLSGRVLNADTQQPITGVHLVMAGGEQVYVTGKAGQYNVAVQGELATLVAMHPQYEMERTIVLPGERDILLKPLQASSEGPSSQRITSRVGDFEFYGQLMIILGRGGEELRVFDAKGNLQSRRNLRQKYQGLYKDCLGNLYLYNSDTAVSIFYNFEEIQFQKGISRFTFDEYVYPCQDHYNNGLLYALHRRRKLVTSIEFGDRSTGTHMVREIVDSNALALLDENYGAEYFRQKSRLSRLDQLANDNLEEDQERLRLDWFDRSRIRPNKVYIFADPQGFSLYDLKRMKHYRYSSADSKPEVSDIKAPEEELQALLKDEASGELFLVYQNRSRLKLLKPGEQTPSFRTEEYAFPQAIKVYNGFLYFISNPNLDGGYYLYRLRL